MVKHRNYKNVWELPEDFPNILVIKAFSQPEVKSPKVIKYGKPDFKNITIFCEKILKLNPHEIEYIVEPLKAEYERRKDQPKITTYFERGIRLGEIVSSRLQSSVNMLIKNQKKAKNGEPSSGEESLPIPKGAMEEEPMKNDKKNSKKNKKVKKIKGTKKSSINNGNLVQDKSKKGKRGKKGRGAKEDEDN